ncbi:MAG TPA: type II secretion system F family protein [Candidatus Limnocylindrales bacterium]|nr:type II secretion system F family protein [Candidatus Limnocylindrales bacterium]
MAFIITPGQLSRRAEFYHQLAQLTAAGIGLPAALEELQRHPPALSYARPIQNLTRELTQGFTLSEALQRLGSWLPEFDIALLHAGEQSGRLDACFRLLSEYYSDRARMARQIIADLLYPAFLFHFAIFILPFAQFFQSGNWVRYLAQTVGVLLPIYLVIGLIIYAAQGRHGETWRAVMESLLHPIPGLGTARRYLALGRLAAALEALLNAGVNIIQAWELAGAACGSPALDRTILAWRPLLDAGQTPAEVVTASSQFPQMFASQYHTGEVSGKLDETLRLLHRFYQEEGSRKLHTIAQWTPRAVYLCIALMIGYRVIHFWTDYFHQVSAAGGF